MNFIIIQYLNSLLCQNFNYITLHNSINVYKTLKAKWKEGAKNMYLTHLKSIIMISGHRVHLKIDLQYLHKFSRN